jgi:hypothetical protein
MGITPWNEHGYCSESCERNSSEFRKKKYKEEQIKMAKKQVTTQDIKETQEKRAAEEAAKTAKAAQAQTQETPATAEQKPAKASKKEAGPAKMRHGAVQDKLIPPTEILPEGWQYVWHDPYTYEGKNGPITVRGHWEKAKKSPPKPKAIEKKPETTVAGTETPKDQAPAKSGSSQSEQK